MTEEPTRTQPVRGTQTLVDQMGWVFKRPLLSLIEVAWRWIFGIPFLLVCARHWKQILAVVPLDSTGWNNLDTQNPWVAVVQLGGVWEHYQPHVVTVLYGLLPVAGLAWVVISGLGRSLLFKRMEPSVRWRPAGVMVLQAPLILLLGLTIWSWLRSMQWVAATHVIGRAEPDLVGFSMWAIYLSLGFFSLWALISWPAMVAPLLMLLEKRSPLSALVESFKLGKVFISKLMEINLVMGIAKLSLMVLAMVLSAAPLPFSDQMGTQTLHVVWTGALVFYFVSNDYFQVVRLKSFLEFWRTLRGSEPAQ